MSDALFEAIDSHDSKRVAALLSAGADPNGVLSHAPGWRPLGAAIEELEFGGAVEVIRLLIKHGADVDAPYIGSKLTPLHAAMFSENMEVIEMILNAGADPNVLSDEGRSPLRFAVEQDSLAMAELFLRHGASSTINNSGGFCGYTALILAVKKLNIEMIRLLLDAGADPEMSDSDGQSPCDHLPRRDVSDPEKWNLAINLLRRSCT